MKKMPIKQEIEKIVDAYFTNKGFEIKHNSKIFNGFTANILATRSEERNYVAIKTQKKDILSSLAQYTTLQALPNITHVYLAIPTKLFKLDIKKIAMITGIGIFAVSKAMDDHIHARELPKAYIRISRSYPLSVQPGQIFEIKNSISVDSKIITNLKIEYYSIEPFSVPPGEKNSKIIETLIPDETVETSLKVKVNEDTKYGNYNLFLKRESDGPLLEVYPYQIKVEKKDLALIKQKMNDSIATLNYALTTNIETLLSDIDEAIMNDVLDINGNIYDESAWNDIGIYCNKNGLDVQAELVYRKMVETIQKYEKKNNVQLHKGLAFNNLGFALNNLGKKEEAKQSFLKAFEEDKRTYGSEAAKSLIAKKTLETDFSSSPD